jgi:hypothetical protein
MRGAVIAQLGLMGCAVAAVGCGGSSNGVSNSTPATASATSTPAASTTPAGPLDVCLLFPQTDAETLVGTPLDPGQAGNPTNPSCTYNGPTSGPTAQVTVYVGDGAKKTYDIDKSLGHAFNMAPGVTADEAWEEDDAIFFRKGSTWAQIAMVLLNDPSQNRVPLEQAAQTLVSRL